MIQATELKNGTTFSVSGDPYKVVKYTHQKIGRGGANVKLTLRNLKTGNLEEKTYNSDHKVDEIITTKKPLQFLYKDAASVVFMDEATYEQTEIPVSLLAEELMYLTEGKTVNVLFWEDKPLSVEIAPKVRLKVTITDPGVKGNSATNIYKPATLENGLKLKVPLFIKQGDAIVVDTRTGEYVERAK